jgi:hypothetical protein
MRRHLHVPPLLAIAVGTTLLLTMPGAAVAQYYGMGMGMGMGWGMMPVGPSPSTQLLNDHALIRSGARTSTRSHNAYAGNPNAYFNRIRDDGFVSHRDVRRRRPPSYQPAQTAPLGNAGQGGTTPQPAAATAAAVESLANFFDASSVLVWPSDAPADPALKEKREVSDRASLAVLEEKKRQGTASITIVADAREKLLDYGRPALRQIREASTPPIADAFHRFLLSLYDSLEAASVPAQGPADQRP